MDLVAPSEPIYSVIDDDISYLIGNGVTVSHAVPYVSGTIALMHSVSSNPYNNNEKRFGIEPIYSEGNDKILLNGIEMYKKVYDILTLTAKKIPDGNCFNHNSSNSFVNPVIIDESNPDNGNHTKKYQYWVFDNLNTPNTAQINAIIENNKTFLEYDTYSYSTEYKNFVINKKEYDFPGPYEGFFLDKLREVPAFNDLMNEQMIKIHDFDYKIQTNDKLKRSWAPRMGFGLVNPFRAVLHSVNEPTINGFPYQIQNYTVLTGNLTTPIKRTISLDLSNSSNLDVFENWNVCHFGRWAYNGTNSSWQRIIDYGGIAFPGASADPDVISNDPYHSIVNNSNGETRINGANTLVIVSEGTILGIDGILIQNNNNGIVYKNQIEGANTTRHKILATGYVKDVSINGLIKASDWEVHSSPSVGTTDYTVITFNKALLDNSEIYGVVNVYDDAKLVVPSGSTLIMQPAGEIHLKGNKDLVVETGATLIMKSGTEITGNKIIVQAGANLIIDDYAKVVIKSEIDNYGTIVLHNNSLARVNKINNIDNGNFDFSADSKMIVLEDGKISINGVVNNVPKKTIINNGTLELSTNTEISSSSAQFLEISAGANMNIVKSSNVVISSTIQNNGTITLQGNSVAYTDVVNNNSGSNVGMNDASKFLVIKDKIGEFYLNTGSNITINPSSPSSTFAIMNNLYINREIIMTVPACSLHLGRIFVEASQLDIGVFLRKGGTLKLLDKANIILFGNETQRTSNNPLLKDENNWNVSEINGSIYSGLNGKATISGFKGNNPYFANQPDKLVFGVIRATHLMGRYLYFAPDEFSISNTDFSNVAIKAFAVDADKFQNNNFTVNSEEILNADKNGYLNQDNLPNYLLDIQEKRGGWNNRLFGNPIFIINNTFTDLSSLPIFERTKPILGYHNFYGINIANLRHVSIEGDLNTDNFYNLAIGINANNVKSINVSNSKFQQNDVGLTATSSQVILCKNTFNNHNVCVHLNKNNTGFSYQNTYTNNLRNVKLDDSYQFYRGENMLNFEAGFLINERGTANLTDVTSDYPIRTITTQIQDFGRNKLEHNDFTISTDRDGKALSDKTSDDKDYNRYHSDFLFNHNSAQVKLSCGYNELSARGQVGTEYKQNNFHLSVTKSPGITPTGIHTVFTKYNRWKKNDNLNADSIRVYVENNVEMVRVAPQFPPMESVYLEGCTTEHIVKGTEDWKDIDDCSKDYGDGIIHIDEPGLYPTDDITNNTNEFNNTLLRFSDIHLSEEGLINQMRQAKHFAIYTDTVINNLNRLVSAYSILIADTSKSLNIRRAALQYKGECFENLDLKDSVISTYSKILSSFNTDKQDCMYATWGLKNTLNAIADTTRGAVYDSLMSVSLRKYVYDITHIDDDGGQYIKQPNIDETILANEINTNSIALVKPNPFSDKAEINYYLAEKSEIKLTLCDIIGNEIIELYSGIKNKGWNTYNLDGSNLTNGTYILKLQSGDKIVTKIIMKIN